MTASWLGLTMVVVGLIVGSFLGLLSVRLPAGEDVVRGRSHCRTCKRTLSPAQLVPVASYVASRGRCRSCGAKVSLRYPLIELGAAGIGLWAALGQSGLWPVALTALLGWQLLLIAVIDAEHLVLPDWLTFPLISSGIVANAILVQGLPWDALIGAMLGFGALRSIEFVYRRFRGRPGLGDGDAFLFAGIGAWVGWGELPKVLLVACVCALSLVAAAATRGRRTTLSTALPFGPFLAIGAWVAWLV